MTHFDDEMDAAWSERVAALTDTIAALRAEVERLTARIPRFPDHMAKIVAAKNEALPERISTLVAAIQSIPDYMRQYQWQADEKQLFGSRWVRTIAGDNGQGMGRQAIAEVVSHIGVADYIAAANPDTVSLLIAAMTDAQARADRAEAELAAARAALERAAGRLSESPMLRVCTTTGGPSHEGQNWVHAADYNDLRRRADELVAAIRALQSAPAPTALQAALAVPEVRAVVYALNSVLMAADGESYGDYDSAIEHAQAALTALKAATP